MAFFSWLHLTDLHRGMREQNWLWPGVKEGFFDDLKGLHDKCGPWDLVLFTGDLTQRGSAEEFQKVDDLLGSLWEKLKECGSSPALLAVPGNHDLVRPSLQKPIPALELLQQWQYQPDVRTEFWETAESPYRLIVNKAFENYTAWWKNQSFKPEGVSAGMLPGDFSYSFEKEGGCLGIVGLNTTFLQLTDDNYTARLALHARQFQQACGGDGPEWARRHHACLLLTHHPPVWLDLESQACLYGEIADHGRFAAQLCGHLHDVTYREVSEGGTEAHRLWQGRSLFGLEYYGEGQGQQRLHGYSAGRIALAEHQGTLTLWPREACPVGLQRDIVPDFSVRLTNDQHTEPRIFKLLKPYRVTGAAPHVPANSASSPPPGGLPALTLQTLINEKIVEELAKVANNATQANVLLAAIGFPAAYRPNFDGCANSMEFWLDVCSQIEDGRVPDGFKGLLQAAAKNFPGNTVFKRFA